MLLTKPACLKGNGITWQIIQMRGSPYLCNIKWVKEKPLPLAQRALHISLIKHQQEDTQMCMHTRTHAHTHTHTPTKTIASLNLRFIMQTNQMIWNKTSNGSCQKGMKKNKREKRQRIYIYGI